MERGGGETKRGGVVEGQEGGCLSISLHCGDVTTLHAICLRAARRVTCLQHEDLEQPDMVRKREGRGEGVEGGNRGGRRGRVWEIGNTRLKWGGGIEADAHAKEILFYFLHAIWLMRTLPPPLFPQPKSPPPTPRSN